MAAMGMRSRQATGLGSMSVSDLEGLVSHLDQFIDD